MLTPSKLKISSLEELAVQVQPHFQECYLRLENGFVCKECDLEILFIEARIDVHVRAADYRCAGPGMTGVAQISYCPNCEERPADIGCIHVPIEYFRPVVFNIIAPDGPPGRMPLGISGLFLFGISLIGWIVTGFLY